MMDAEKLGKSVAAGVVIVMAYALVVLIYGFGIYLVVGAFGGDLGFWGTVQAAFGVTIVVNAFALAIGKAVKNNV